VKLYSVVKVCAGEAIAVAAQNIKTMQTIFHALDFFIPPPFRLRPGTRLAALKCAVSRLEIRSRERSRNFHQKERA
jgi:hypothetical protein